MHPLEAACAGLHSAGTIDALIQEMASMSRPTPLDDERFVAPPPLGYKSEQGRSIHIGLMIAFAVVTILGPIGFQVYEQFRMQGQMQQGFILARSFLPSMSAKWGDKIVVATKDQYVGGVGGASERGSLVAFSLKDGSPVKLPMEANGGIANPLADAAPLAVVANDETAFLITNDALYSATTAEGGIKAERVLPFDLQALGLLPAQEKTALARSQPVAVESLHAFKRGEESFPLFYISFLEGASPSDSPIFAAPPVDAVPEPTSSDPLPGTDETADKRTQPGIDPSAEVSPSSAVTTTEEAANWATPHFSGYTFLIVGSTNDRLMLVAASAKGSFYRSTSLDELPRAELPFDSNSTEPNVGDELAWQTHWERIEAPGELEPFRLFSQGSMVRLVTLDADTLDFSIYERSKTGWNPEPRLITRADLDVAADGEVSVIPGEDDQTYVFLSNDVAHGLRMHKVVAGQLQSPIVLAGWMAQPAVAWYVAVIGQNMIFGFAILFVIGIVPTVLMALFRTSHVELADTTVQMASILRRGIAKMIDMFLIFTPPYAIAGYFLYQADWPAIIAEFQDPNFARQGLSAWLIRGLFWGLAACIYAMTTFLLYCWMEGTWGKTPGKLVCGIETLRTTLRPCGFFRSILRNAAMMIDMFFNYVVGVMLIALQYKWQRVGDLLADTVVVRTRRPHADADGTMV
ncbi:MAG: hypothetical protein C0478_02395 [Planctomyces sp.]|nr:hypothetical protein [Planctomyces sp.]